MMNMTGDTTPLRAGKKSNSALKNVDTTNPKEHYIIAAAGFYGNHQYADLSLIVKRRPLGSH